MVAKEMTRAQLIALFEQKTDHKKKPEHEERKEATQRGMALRSMLADENRQEVEKQADVIGGIAAALAAAKGHHPDAAKWAAKRWGENSVIAKSLDMSSDVAGGFTISEELSTNVIDLLQATAIMRTMGCQVLPLVNGQLRIPKIGSAASATYLSEGGTIQATQPGFGQLLLQGKKLGAKVPISNDLLKFSALNIDTIVRQHIVKRMGLREDLAFIEGNGDSGTPVGIRNHMLPGNQIAQTAAPATAVTATTDASRAVSVLDNANVDDTKRGWIMRPSNKNWLAQVREATGALAFPGMSGPNPVFWGYPVATSTQLSIDVIGPPTQNMVYLCEFPNLIIGDSYTLEILASDTAAYTDATSTLVSPFDRDETVIRCISMHDFGMEHDEAAAALTGVTWGGGAGG
jgi:HK97 family phage major capsid protein